MEKRVCMYYCVLFQQSENNNNGESIRGTKCWLRIFFFFGRNKNTTKLCHKNTVNGMSTVVRIFGRYASISF
jgi:hypothetical protein